MKQTSAIHSMDTEIIYATFLSFSKQYKI